MRLSGRRRQAYRPVPTKLQPTDRAEDRPDGPGLLMVARQHERDEPAARRERGEDDGSGARGGHAWQASYVASQLAAPLSPVSDFCLSGLSSASRFVCLSLQTGAGAEAHRSGRGRPSTLLAAWPPTTTSVLERELIAAARAGDEDAYRRLVEPRHAELHAHCYRMLGSVHDAEDSLQEALLRAWRGLPRFEDRSSLRAWLYKISTNTCLDELARRPKRVLPIDFGPSAELNSRARRAAGRDGLGRALPGRGARWRAAARPRRSIEQRESVELAFVAALQHLPAAAARGVDPARGARLLGAGGRRRARDDAGRRQQRAPARPQGRRRAAAGREPAGHAARARRRAHPRAGRALHAGAGRWRRRRARRDARRGRDLVDAAVAQLVPGCRGDRRVPRRVSVPRALAPRPDQRERAAGGRLLHVGPRARALRRRRARRAHAARDPRSSPSPGSSRPGSTGASATCRG